MTQKWITPIVEELSYERFTLSPHDAAGEVFGAVQVFIGGLTNAETLIEVDDFEPREWVGRGLRIRDADGGVRFAGIVTEVPLAGPFVRSVRVHLEEVETYAARRTVRRSAPVPPA